MPDCSTTACPSKCQCIESNCAAEINDCLSDATCASGQACADACPCGDKACITKCALKDPSPKALPVLKCASAHCGLEASAMPDCSTTACPSKCQCIESNCAAEINDCLSDATCAS